MFPTQLFYMFGKLPRYDIQLNTFDVIFDRRTSKFYTQKEFKKHLKDEIRTAQGHIKDITTQLFNENGMTATFLSVVEEETRKELQYYRRLERRFKQTRSKREGIQRLIARAKEYPIIELIDFNRQGTRLCLWHQEKTPSLHYNKKNNRVHCFGCGKNADSIDVYQHEHNCDFITAVNALGGK